MARIDYGVKWEEIAKANATIKTTAIHNKDYAEVNQRVKAFRSVYPTGFIITHMTLDNGLCIFRAEVGFYTEAGPAVIASGTAYEKEGSTQINRTSYIENCETSAVGRALGMAGFGIETSICSVEELENAMHQQVQGAPTQPAQPPAAPIYEPAKDTPDEAEFRAMVETLYKPEDLDRWMLKKFNMPFGATPVAMIKTVMPEDKVRAEYARMTQPPAEAQQETTTETTEGGKNND